MYRYFTHAKSYRCVDVLQDLVHSYNHTYHSSIGMPPATVSVKKRESSSTKIISQKAGKTKMAVRHRPTSENQQAKASIRERLLARMVGRNFHHQQEIPTSPVTYAIVADEEIKRRFYELDLQLIIKEDNVYDVEKVLKTKRRTAK